MTPEVPAFPFGIESVTVHPLSGSSGSLHSIERFSDNSEWQRWKQKPGDFLVIVNDGTRPTPTAEIIESDKGFFSSERVHYIVATGAHRGPEGDEWTFIFGRLYPLIKDRIHVHDARDFKNLDYFGTTAGGSEVRFNKILREFVHILVIGSVEPHYFAGFTGGRKAFLPGLAGIDAITANHRMALIPDAGLMKLDANPVHEDMVEAARMVLDGLADVSVFSIMCVLDRTQKIFSLHCGGLEEAFSSAVEAAHTVFTAPVERAADIIITYASSPMNRELYQSQKAIENVRGALAPGGTVILVSECEEGIGDRVFYDLLASENSPEKVLEKIKSGYVLGYHKAAKLAELATEADIFAVTGIDDTLLEAVFIRSFKSLQAAFDEACDGFLKRTGRNPFVLIVADGSVTVPVLVK